MQEDVNLLPQNRVFFPRGKLRRRNKGEEKERGRNQGKADSTLAKSYFPIVRLSIGKKKRKRKSGRILEAESESEI